MKTIPSEHDICDLCVHFCANGADQTADLEESCSPVHLGDSLRITIALEEAFGLCLSLIDVISAHKATRFNEDQMSCTFPSPFCAE